MQDCREEGAVHLLGGAQQMHKSKQMKVAEKEIQTECREKQITVIIRSWSWCPKALISPSVEILKT